MGRPGPMRVIIINAAMDAPPIQYVRTSDGYDIAYTVCGGGRPLVVLPQPFNHQQHLWETSGGARDSLFEPLAGRRRLVHFDARGLGMSSRGLADDHTIESYLPDMDAVVESEALEQFAIFASYEFWRVAVRYSALHPDRVEGLVLFNPDPPVGPEPGRSHPFDAIAALEWENFLFMMSSSYNLVRDGGDPQIDRERVTVTQADYLKMLRAGMTDDARPSLAAIKAPTLIISEHPPGVAEDYRLVVAGRQIAAAIKGSQLVPVEGMGLALHSAGPEPSIAIRLIEDFLSSLEPATSKRTSVAARTTTVVLSTRELDVLRLLAQGKSNPEIAKELFITRNTVQNHVSSILTKTNLTNRAQAAVYARDHGIA